MLSLASPRIAPYFLNLKKDSKSAENHPFFVRKIRRDTVHVYFQYLGATVGQRQVDKIRDFLKSSFFQSFFFAFFSRFQNTSGKSGSGRPGALQRLRCGFWERHC